MQNDPAGARSPESSGTINGLKSFPPADLSLRSAPALPWTSAQQTVKPLRTWDREGYSIDSEERRGTRPEITSSNVSNQIWICLVCVVRNVKRPSFARAKRCNTCLMHSVVQGEGRDTLIRIHQIPHHIPQQTRSESSRPSSADSHHTKQETQNLLAAAATLSPPCALSTCEHPPAASISHTPACAIALGTSNSGTGSPFARGSFAEQRKAAYHG